MVCSPSGRLVFGSRAGRLEQSAARAGEVDVLDQSRSPFSGIEQPNADGGVAAALRQPLIASA
jgi:hypothetical protein